MRPSWDKRTLLYIRIPKTTVWEGNAGSNTLSGGGGEDVALFRGTRQEYDVSCEEGACQIVDTITERDDTTNTINIGQLSFRNSDWKLEDAEEGCFEAADACWKLVGRRSCGTASSSSNDSTESSPSNDRTDSSASHNSISGIFIGIILLLTLF